MDLICRFKVWLYRKSGGFTARDRKICFQVGINASTEVDADNQARFLKDTMVAKLGDFLETMPVTITIERV